MFGVLWELLSCELVCNCVIQDPKSWSLTSWIHSNDLTNLSRGFQKHYTLPHLSRTWCYLLIGTKKGVPALAKHGTHSCINVGCHCRCRWRSQPYCSKTIPNHAIPWGCSDSKRMFMMLKFRRFTLQSRIGMPYSLLLLAHVEVRVGWGWGKIPAARK